MAKRKKVQKLTLNEFKNWIAGVSEFKGESWSPSPDEWKLILEKIDNIVEETKDITIPQSVIDDIKSELVDTVRNIGMTHPTTPVAVAQPPLNIPPTNAYEPVTERLSTAEPGMKPEVVGDLNVAHDDGSGVKQGARFKTPTITDPDAATGGSFV